MNRHGMSTIELIAVFILVVVGIYLATQLYAQGFERTGQDLDGLRSCAGRASQAGGRGACSATAQCSEVSVGAGEYASYLGLPCDPPQNGAAYCCIVLPNGRNPPATIMGATCDKAMAAGTIQVMHNGACGSLADARIGYDEDATIWFTPGAQEAADGCTIRFVGFVTPSGAVSVKRSPDSIVVNEAYTCKGTAPFLHRLGSPHSWERVTASRLSDLGLQDGYFSSGGQLVFEIRSGQANREFRIAFGG